jgi:hypothetical protein
MTTCNERAHDWAPPHEDKPNWWVCHRCSTEHYVSPGHLLRWLRQMKEQT